MTIGFQREMTIPVQDVLLTGELALPSKAEAIIVFAHGSGSSRLSQRNRQVAAYLRERNFGTLLFDLLTTEEDKYTPNRFNIDLLTTRLAGATEWLEGLPAAKGSRIGYFGASTGAASALQAAALLPHKIQAVVSRGGRPDLAMDQLQFVKAPTLLLIGSLDHDVVELNKEALEQLRCEKKLELIEGATHLFEEPGAMEKVCERATAWFEKYLQPAGINM